MDHDKLAEVITQILSKDFKNIKIVKVDIAEDFDRDGDAILRVNVVFEGDRANLDARNISSAVRRIRPALEDVEGMPFPLVAFIAQEDYCATGA